MYDPELELYKQVVKPAQNKLIEMGPRVVPYLVGKLLLSQNDATKKSLLIILARIRDARAVSAVRAIVKNPAHSESVRATAAWALRFFPSTENVDLLIDVLTTIELDPVKTYWVEVYKESRGSVPVQGEMLAQTLRGMRVSTSVNWEPPDGFIPFLDLQVFYAVEEICYRLSILPSPPPTYCDWSGEEVPIEEKEKVRKAWVSWWHYTRNNIPHSEGK
jgi:HEAT repeat protein